jgi:hypothetical protein
MKKKFLLLAFSASVLASCGGEKKEEKTEAAPADTTAETKPVEDTLEVDGMIEFPSKDGLSISADSYEVIPGEQYILLCHQAGFSRGEYIETAKTFNAMGYNCMAIDQRSGEVCNKIENETAKRAAEQKLPMDYADAEQDILAAIDYIHNHTGKSIILVGSSYSASLALKIAKSNEHVDAVMAFSPGEYFKGINLEKELKGFSKPVFVTSSKKEGKDVAKLISGVNSPIKIQFIPETEGDHGSRVLWPTTPDKDAYWTAVKEFLQKIKTPA